MYLVNTFEAKEICKIPCYHILLNVLQLLILGIVVAECVADTLRLCPFIFSFPCLSNIFLFACATDYDIYRVKTIACEAFFQFKSNLNVFKGAVINCQEIVAAFTSFYHYSYTTYPIKLLQILL